MLNTQPNLQACDDFYEALIAAHQGLSTPESHAMNARLVLLLANHIGDQATLHTSPLNTPDTDTFAGTQVPGAVLLDAPLTKQGQPVWLLRALGPDFTLITFGAAPAWAQGISRQVQVLQIGVDVQDAQGLATQRLDAQPGTAYLVRPDQHVCARWRVPTETAVRQALARALAA